jgi:polyisoprenoid-binding protein YceI
MKTLKLTRNVFLMTFLLLSSWNTIIAQDQKVVLSESKLTVFGTSNLHDWDIEAKAMSGKSNFVIVSNVLTSIESLEFAVESEQLLSGKSGMDSNTFKALNSKKYKTINYKLTKVNKITKVSANSYSVETQGDLTISGLSKNITQTFTVVVSGKKIIISGKTKINMTQYKIVPPTALFGTIKTGPEVTIDFKVTYN